MSITNSEKAVNKFKEGYNCAQSVLYGLSAFTELSENDSLKIATGFGSGMGRTQNVCGAISGGILTLNLLYGRGLNDEKEKQNELYAKVRDLINNFELKNNTIICKELLNGCDLSTDEGQEKFKSQDMIKQCHSYVTDVITIMENILKD